jgi:hypothetical protein
MKSIPRALVMLAAALLSVAEQGRAADRTYAYEAETAQPAKAGAVAAGGVRWSCSGTRCTASGRGGKVSARGCSELARRVGPIAAYRSEIRRLADGDLAECNRIALGTAAASKSAKALDRPQRATTDELTYTGVWPPAATAGARSP